MNIGQKIKSRRNELGINADELAKAVGVSPSTIFRYEKGDIEKMPTSVLEKIAIKLKTTPGYLMNWQDDQQPQQTEAAHAIKDEFTPEEWDEIENFMQWVRDRKK